MPRITRSALVMFSAEQMFRLVNDVDAYPEFLPGCVGSRVHESGEDYMMASVDVVRAQHGSVDRYLTLVLGIDGAARERLAELYLET